jgi:hypothetical protein
LFSQCVHRSFPSFDCRRYWIKRHFSSSLIAANLLRFSPNFQNHLGAAAARGGHDVQGGAGTPTVVRYGAVAKWPSPLSPPFPTTLQFPRLGDRPPDGGGQFFGGGNVATATLSQTVSGAAAQIETGNPSLPNLVENVEKAGKRWAAYEQSMPAPCFGPAF